MVWRSVLERSERRKSPGAGASGSVAELNVS